VGFIGLGRMGQPIARRLRAGGLALTVHDAARGRAGRPRPGWRVAASPAGVARECGTIFLALPDDRAVDAVVGGPRGLAAGLRRGAVVVDLGTSSPAGTRRRAARLARRGATLVDAPVSGGVPGARTGDLVVMAGGSASTVRRLRPLLARVGRRVVHAGPTGAGHVLKSLNNYVTAATLVAVWEAVLLAGRRGLRPATVVAALSGGSARSGVSQVKFPRYVLSRRYDSDGSLGAVAKDLAIARAVAGRRADAALLGQVAALWTHAAGPAPEADHCLVGREVARRLGTVLPPGLRPRVPRR
jgi:3-hydroxyisobutyrate dehydrogenase